MCTKEELIEFYDARDQFLGRGNSLRHQDTVQGLKRLQASRVPEACYIGNLFWSIPRSREEIKRVLLANPNATTLAYAGMVNGWDEDLVQQAVDMGNTYAMGEMANRLNVLAETAFRLAKAAADAGVRGGLAMLAFCYDKGLGCKADGIRSRAAYKQATELGDAHGMTMYAVQAFLPDNPERYRLLGRAACLTSSWYTFDNDVSRYVSIYYAQGSCPSVLITVGSFLKERPCVPSTQMSQIIDAYNQCMYKTRNAVLCWILIARKMGLYKDVARLIAQEVWNDKEAFY